MVNAQNIVELLFCHLELPSKLVYFPEKKISPITLYVWDIFNQK
jgi:hypothetical protein